MYHHTLTAITTKVTLRLENFGLVIHKLTLDSELEGLMLNFTTCSQGDEYEPCHKKSRGTARDPGTHRIIEKRRRDRMNNCLADLSDLIPPNYLKHGQGRIEKTEIVEMAIKHIRSLQAQIKAQENGEQGRCCREKFTQGFLECLKHMTHYLVGKLGYNPGDPFCVNLLQYLHEQLAVGQSLGEETTSTTTLASEDGLVAPQAEEPSESGNDVTLQMSKLLSLRRSEPSRYLREGRGESKSFSSGESCATGPSGSSGTPSIAQRLSSLVDFDQGMKALMKGSGGGGGGQPRSLADFEGDTMDIGDQSSSSYLMLGDRDSGIVEEDGGPSDNFSLHTSYDSSGNQISLSGAYKNVYKYKNDMKLRFIENSEKRGDVVDGEGVEEEEEGGRCKMTSMPPPPEDKLKDMRSHQNNQTSDTTSYPGSDFSNGNISSSGNGSPSGNGNSSVHSSSPSCSSSSSGLGTTLDLTNSVPGFALHPAGTYYIPVITPASQLMPFLQNYGSMGICHPVSIPVNFSGAFLTMQNIRVAQTGGSKGKDFTLKKEPCSSGRKRKNHE